jgi:hypothetical protein
LVSRFFFVCHQSQEMTHKKISSIKKPPKTFKSYWILLSEQNSKNVLNRFWRQRKKSSILFFNSKKCHM